MKKTAVTGALLGVLLLAGCAAPGGLTSEVAPPVALEETVAPLAAEEPTAAEAGDAAYLAYVRENLPNPTSIPNATDEQLLAAGQEACDRIAAGESTEAMVVVEGEQPWENGTYYDSATIITGASVILCPA